MSVASPGYFDRKSSSAQVRPGLAHLQAEPLSPHTPQRAISSAISSPSASYRAEEEPIVFEIGARYLRAGFAGESCPRCTLKFGPEESRRVGDYRSWLPGWQDRPRRERRIDTWGNEHELWRMDVRDVDIGLVEDKIERAVREVYLKYLLLDYKSTKKLMLILPSVMPYHLLSAILNTLFHSSPAPPAITVLSSPVLGTAAAGCRSSLSIDIGWRETIVTAICEYREIRQWRSTRAMRMVVLEMGRMLEAREKLASGEVQQFKGDLNHATRMEFEQAEEITARLAWCQNRGSAIGDSTPTEDSSISIPSPASSRQNIQVPFSAFARPVEDSLLKDPFSRELDDNEQTLHLLLYKALLALPVDVRMQCMSRIIFTGGGSNIPGLRSRLLEELSVLVNNRGWDPIFGRIADSRRMERKDRVIEKGEETPNEKGDAPVSGNTATEDSPEEQPPPHLDPRQPDFVDEKFLKGHEGRSKPAVVLAGFVRSIETLGAWAGASLLASMRIKGIVEIDRDVYLQYGLAGARKDAAEASVVARGGLSHAVTKAGDRTGWTLGAWA